GLLNTTISSSPMVFTTTPSRAAMTSFRAPRQASIALAAGLSPSSSYSAVLPLTSANRIALSLEMRVIDFGKVSPISRGLPTAGPDRGAFHERQCPSHRAQVLHQRRIQIERQAIRQDQSGGRNRRRAGTRGRRRDGRRGGTRREGGAERALGEDGAPGAGRPAAQGRRRHREALRRLPAGGGRGHG